MRGGQFLEENMNMTHAVSRYPEVFGFLLRPGIRDTEGHGPGMEAGYGWR